MKKISIILALSAVTMSCQGNENGSNDSLSVATEQQETEIKRYDVKSGIVKYETTIEGKVLGSKVSGSGVEELYFKNYGAVELKEEKSSQTTITKFLGQEEEEKSETHKMVKIENDKTYIVDFDRKLITKSENMGMMLMGDEKDAGQTGKEMMIAMGGELIGEEKYQGYNCEIWTLLGTKQWLHKRVMLKLESELMGIKTTTEAVSIKFNVSVPEDKFKLPDFKIQESDDFMNDGLFNESMEDDEMMEEEEMSDDELRELSKMSFEEWKREVTANDEEMKEMSDEELRQTYDMMQRVIKLKLGK